MYAFVISDLLFSEHRGETKSVVLDFMNSFPDTKTVVPCDVTGQRQEEWAAIST